MKLNAAIIISAGITAEAFTSPLVAGSSRAAFISSFHGDESSSSCLYLEKTKPVKSKVFSKTLSAAPSKKKSKSSPEGATSKTNKSSDKSGGAAAGAVGSEKNSAVADANPLSASENFHEKTLGESVASSATVRSGRPGVTVEEKPFSGIEGFRERSVSESVASSVINSYTVRSSATEGKVDKNPCLRTEGFRERTTAESRYVSGKPLDDWSKRPVSGSMASSTISSAAVRSSTTRANVGNNSLSEIEGFRERPTRDSLFVSGKPLDDWSERPVRGSAASSGVNSAPVRSSTTRANVNKNSCSRTEDFRERPRGKSLWVSGKPLGQW